MIDALVISRAEFLFQAERLADTVSESDASEALHLRNLMKRYADAAKTTTILIRYQRGRLRRAANQQQANTAHFDEGTE